jgi:hypothetical protein
LSDFATSTERLVLVEWSFSSFLVRFVVVDVIAVFIVVADVDVILLLSFWLSRHERRTTDECSFDVESPLVGFTDEEDKLSDEILTVDECISLDDEDDVASMADDDDDDDNDEVAAAEERDDEVKFEEY